MPAYQNQMERRGGLAARRAGPYSKNRIRANVFQMLCPKLKVSLPYIRQTVVHKCLCLSQPNEDKTTLGVANLFLTPASQVLPCEVPNHAQTDIKPAQDLHCTVVW